MARKKTSFGNTLIRWGFITNGCFIMVSYVGHMVWAKIPQPTVFHVVAMMCFAWAAIVDRTK